MEMFYLLDPNINWKIDEPHTSSVESFGVNCPKCDRRGFRRHGIRFDHEWRCGHCNLSWEPDKKYMVVKIKGVEI